MVVEHRKVEGPEKEDLLARKKPKGFNYDAYLDVLSRYNDGDVVAVRVDDESKQRGEKIRFSRAARRINKSTLWLANPSRNEIAFQIGPPREKRARAKHAS